MSSAFICGTSLDKYAECYEKTMKQNIAHEMKGCCRHSPIIYLVSSSREDGLLNKLSLIKKLN